MGQERIELSNRGFRVPAIPLWLLAPINLVGEVTGCEICVTQN